MKHPNVDSVKGSHCSYCGAKFAEQDKWPRKCFICWNESYKNPIPVVVMIIPVYTRHADHPAQCCGWLIGKRNIEPQKGGWAFPGGYVEGGESYRDACVRELQEEIGIIAKPEDFVVWDMRNDDSGHMLIFCYHTGALYRDEINFTPNDEVSEIDFPLAPEHKELCFPTHNEMWEIVYGYNFT